MTDAATAMGLLIAIALAISFVAIALLPWLDDAPRRYKRPKPTDEGHLDREY